MADQIGNLPVWVRRADGGQVPFEADRICQSLYAAAESLGAASAFLSRELTDTVLHFLIRDECAGIVTTRQIAEHVEKIVREVGQPALARRYAEMLQQPDRAGAPGRRVTISSAAPPVQFVQECLEAYGWSTIYSADVAAAVREGLLHFRPGVTAAPASLTTLVLDTPRLAELPWWLALDEWRACGGDLWIVESPEWLCNAQTHPALTPHLCDQLLSMPMIADRGVELHLNIADPPAWALAQQVRPLFAPVEDDFMARERAVFLDSLLERWKTLEAPRIPALAWHLCDDSFREENQRRQLHGLMRLALQGKPIRFVLDRPGAAIALAEGLDRRTPGVLLEIGLDLGAFAARADVGDDAACLLRKLPSLARIAVSAAAQKRQYLRKLADVAPLKQGFLLERAPSVVTPIGLAPVVRACTGESLAKSPLSLQFALRILQALKETLGQAGRSINLDVRVDGPTLCEPREVGATLHQQIDSAGKLHARAGAGAMVLTVPVAAESEPLIELLHGALKSTGVVRVQIQRAETNLLQGELAIDP